MLDLEPNGVNVRVRTLVPRHCFIHYSRTSGLCWPRRHPGNHCYRRGEGGGGVANDAFSAMRRRPDMIQTSDKPGRQGRGQARDSDQGGFSRLGPVPTDALAPGNTADAPTFQPRPIPSRPVPPGPARQPNTPAARSTDKNCLSMTPSQRRRRRRRTL